MFNLAIVGIALAVMSMVAWCIEAAPSVLKLRRLQHPNPRHPLMTGVPYIVGFTQAALGLWVVAVDLGATLWLVGAFGLSGTVTGSVIGLALSNVLSIFLLTTQWRR